MIKLTKTAETASTITLSWEPVPNAVGYRFIVDGKTSHTWDPTRTSVKVAKGAERTLVEALGALDSGVWPQATTPPPDPAPAGKLHLKWDKVADIPDLHDGDRGRLSDVTLSSMPAGVTNLIKVTVTGVADSSGGGDGSYGTTGNMNEPWISEGGETWQSCYQLIPDGTDPRYPGRWRHSVVSSGWNTMPFEYHEPGIGPASMHFGVWGDDPPIWQMSCTAGKTTDTTAVWCRGETLRFNVWQRHLIHIRWSKGNAGYIEWWVDDRLQVGRQSVNVVSSWGGPRVADNYPTAWDHNGQFKAPYFQAGHYRGPERTDTDTTYLAKLRVASTRELALA